MPSIDIYNALAAAYNVEDKVMVDEVVLINNG